MKNVIRLNPKIQDEQSYKKNSQTRTEVEVVRRRDNDFPMLLIKGRGYMHSHGNGFLLARYYHPTFFDEELGQVTPKTIRNYADHLRYWLNICALCEKSYLYADYSFLSSILKALRDDGKEEDSLRQYVATWRLFYLYLDTSGVPHHMDLPKKIKVSRVISDTEKKGDFLNYTKRVGALSTMIDPLIDNRRRTKQSSYLSQVLTREQMKSLIKELRKIDVVYAVMAKVQFDTLLRIAELINHFPHTSNDLNPKFKCWGEMHVSGQKLQQFNFIGKGQVKRQIDIDIRTLKLLEDKYLTSKLPNSDITVYDERKQKFLTEYLDSKNGRKSRHNHDDDILWMSESGRPVSIGMYQEAFRQAGSKLKSENLIQEHVHVRPHAMRHTGATLRLIKYREETGVDIHVDNDGDIHSFLQSLLGHSSILTTHRYIRTVRATTFSDLAVKTIIRNEEIWDEELLTNKALKRGVDAIKGV